MIGRIYRCKVLEPASIYRDVYAFLIHSDTRQNKSALQTVNSSAFDRAAGGESSLHSRRNNNKFIV